MNACFHGTRVPALLLIISIPAIAGSIGSCVSAGDASGTAQPAPPSGAVAQTAATGGRTAPVPMSIDQWQSLRITALPPCEPASGGRDFQVGTAEGQLTSLDQVPWESLVAGDTVRIFHRAAPYRGKMLLTARGTARAPVRVCGVKGPGGERPVVDGSGASTRRGLFYGTGTNGLLREARAVVMIKNASEYTDFPTHIQIDGLVIRGAHPDYRFTDTNGRRQQYTDFGGCIWIDRGHNITIADNELTDCTNGIFSKSTDEGDFAVSRNVRLVRNHIHGNGIAGSDRLHNSYIQSVGAVYEFNLYGPLRKDAGGAALKDRSVGTVVRFNRIEEGARSLDLVEAEDFPETAMADPAYRTTFVYGNQIVKNGDSGSFFHYGGDHYGSTPGANWGEPFFRKGTLYFFNNTVHVTGSGEYTVLFNLSTTEEKAEIWNNVFYYTPKAKYASLRQGSDIGAAWTAGGILNFGRNWINANWMDSDEDHPVKGKINGTDNFLTGQAPPFELDYPDPSTRQSHRRCRAGTSCCGVQPSRRLSAGPATSRPSHVRQLATEPTSEHSNAELPAS